MWEGTLGPSRPGGGKNFEIGSTWFVAEKKLDDLTWLREVQTLSIKRVMSEKLRLVFSRSGIRRPIVNKFSILKLFSF